MIDLKECQNIIIKGEWFYNCPVAYSYYEAVENDYNVDEIIEYLGKVSFGKTFFETFYNENKVEIEDYLLTMENAGDNITNAEYRCKVFLNYFANHIARAKIQNKYDLPDWLEFTLHI